jgi:hypothetical protein
MPLLPLVPEDKPMDIVFIVELKLRDISACIATPKASFFVIPCVFIVSKLAINILLQMTGNPKPLAISEE